MFAHLLNAVVCVLRYAKVSGVVVLIYGLLKIFFSLILVVYFTEMQHLHWMHFAKQLLFYGEAFRP